MTGRSVLLMMLSLFFVTAAVCSGEAPVNPGVRTGILPLCPSSPNCVSSQAEEARHRIAPLAFSGDPEVEFSRLFAVLKGRSDTRILRTTPERIEVEFHTIFFVDDALFVLDSEQKSIQLRSASRVGYSDFGKNRKRIEEIRAAFAKEGK